MIKRKIMPLMLAGLLVLCMLSTAMAASASFNVNLPAYQGDKRISSLSRTDSGLNYFYVYPTAMGDGFENVYAWTKSASGTVLSSKYNNLDVGTYNNLKYSSIPSEGTVVQLYMRNPEYSSSTPQIVGYWSPN